MKLNADLGEHEPFTRTRALMRLIDQANIACGGHAGTEETMERAVALALEHRVEIGAHPGLTGDFGRGGADIASSDLESLVAAQTEALAGVVRCLGGGLRHIKLHGALYHAVERSAPMATAYVDLIRLRYPSMRIVALAGGRVVDLCRRLGVEVLPEAFAERGYRKDGTLVPRGQPGDLIIDPRSVATTLRNFAEKGGVAIDSGAIVKIDAATICVHSDTPNAVRIARAAREALGPRLV